MRENMSRAAGDKILELENFRRVLRTELELLCSASNVSQCSSKIEPSKSNPILEQSTTGVFSLSVKMMGVSFNPFVSSVICMVTPLFHVMYTLIIFRGWLA